jgi:hypothetical protein
MAPYDVPRLSRRETLAGTLKVQRTLGLVAVVSAGLLAIASGGPATALTTRTRAAATPGIVTGNARTVRLRPVVATAPAAPAKRPKRAAREAAAAALAACDGAHVRALRATPNASAGVDPPEHCIVAIQRGAGADGPRLLLGPAPVTGTDVKTVTMRRQHGGTFAIVLRTTASRTQNLDALAGAHLHQRLALTLDGAVVATFAVEPSAAAFTSLAGSVTIPLRRGTSKGDVAALISELRDARSELLVSLLGRATMTRDARQVVASVTATVDEKARFAADCPVKEAPDSLVIGCFGDGTLHVLRVDRPDIAPAMVVSAAHEMLHGVYERLAPKARRHIDALLDSFYSTLDDPELKAVVATYATTEPGQRLNELHSLLPTEVEHLSPALERYYRQYFGDRRKIVAAFMSYDRVFTDLEAKHDALQSQLDGLQTQLDASKKAVDAAGAQADSLSSQIDSLRAQGRIGESNRLVGPQNAAVDRANSLLQQYNALVDQFNAVVTQYNAVVQSGRDIYDSVSAIPFLPSP